MLLLESTAKEKCGTAVKTAHTFEMSYLYIKQRPLLCRRETQDLLMPHAIIPVRSSILKQQVNIREPNNAK